MIHSMSNKLKAVKDMCDRRDYLRSWDRQVTQYVLAKMNHLVNETAETERTLYDQCVRIIDLVQYKPEWLFYYRGDETGFYECDACEWLHHITTLEIKPTDEKTLPWNLNK